MKFLVQGFDLERSELVSLAWCPPHTLLDTRCACCLLCPLRAPYPGPCTGHARLPGQAPQGPLSKLQGYSNAPHPASTLSPGSSVPQAKDQGVLDPPRNQSCPWAPLLVLCLDSGSGTWRCTGRIEPRAFLSPQAPGPSVSPSLIWFRSHRKCPAPLTSSSGVRGPEKYFFDLRTCHTPPHLTLLFPLLTSGRTVFPPASLLYLQGKTLEV